MKVGRDDGGAADWAWGLAADGSTSALAVALRSGQGEHGRGKTRKGEVGASNKKMQKQRGRECFK